MTEHRVTEFMPTAEAALALSISRKGVLSLLANGRLQGRKIGDGQRGVWLIEAAEVERYQRERRPAGRPKGTDNE